MIAPPSLEALALDSGLTRAFAQGSTPAAAYLLAPPPPLRHRRSTAKKQTRRLLLVADVAGRSGTSHRCCYSAQQSAQVSQSVPAYTLRTRHPLQIHCPLPRSETFRLPVNQQLASATPPPALLPSSPFEASKAIPKAQKRGVREGAIPSAGFLGELLGVDF